VLGKATPGNDADHDQTEPLDHLPNCPPRMCLPCRWPAHGLWDLIDPGQQKVLISTQWSDVRLTCQLCAATHPVLDRGSVGDARDYKTAIVGTNYQRLTRRRLP
jgi:hypothetical protein